MAGGITIKGQKAKRGKRMTKGAGWRLATTTGRKRVFEPIRLFRRAPGLSQAAMARLDCC